MQLHCLLASSMVKENSYQSEIFLLIEFVLSAQSQIPFSINNWSSGILSWYTVFPHLSSLELSEILIVYKLISFILWKLSSFV